jgi:hypothetical protein
VFLLLKEGTVVLIHLVEDGFFTELNTSECVNEVLICHIGILAL